MPTFGQFTFLKCSLAKPSVGHSLNFISPKLRCFVWNQVSSPHSYTDMPLRPTKIRYVSLIVYLSLPGSPKLMLTYVIKGCISAGVATLKQPLWLWSSTHTNVNEVCDIRAAIYELINVPPEWSMMVIILPGPPTPTQPCFPAPSHLCQCTCPRSCKMFAVDYILTQIYVDNTYHLIRRSMSCLYFFCCFGPPSTTTMFTSCKNISVRWQSLQTFVAWQFPQNFIVQKHSDDIFICQCQYYQSVNTLDLIKEDCASHEKLLSVFLQLPFLRWVPQIFHSSGKDLESFFPDQF